MDELHLILRAFPEKKGIGGLQKPEKVYLHHPNLNYSFSPKNCEIGDIREGFFFNQLQVNHKIAIAKKGDFSVGNFIFEIGGKNKINKQIQGIKNAYVVADEIEIGHNNKIPLWLFGFLY